MLSSSISRVFASSVSKHFDKALGIYYGLDNSKSPDPKSGIDLFRKAFQLGSSEAGYHLGMALEEHPEFQKDYGTPEDWYLKSAEKGNAPAQFAVGKSLLKESVNIESILNAKFWFEKASASNFAPAQYDLGVIYEKYLDKPKIAFDLYKQSAEKNFPASLYQVALFHESGDLGLSPNETSSYLKKAIELNYPPALSHWGIKLAEKNDIPSSLPFLEKAAKLGDSQANHNLLLYKIKMALSPSNINTQDIENLVEPLFDSSYPPSQHLLASLISNGIVDKDINIARDLFNKAGHSGFMPSFLALAKLNQNDQFNKSEAAFEALLKKQNSSLLQISSELLSVVQEYLEKQSESTSNDPMLPSIPHFQLTERSFYSSLIYEPKSIFSKEFGQNIHVILKVLDLITQESSKIDIKIVDEAKVLYAFCLDNFIGINSSGKSTKPKVLSLLKSSNSAEAHYQLGRLYLSENNVDMKIKAVEEFWKASQKNHPNSNYILGLCSQYGLGCEKDLQNALQWYHQGYKLGDVDSTFAFANALQSGLGIDLEDEDQRQYAFTESLAILNKLADINHPGALVNLGNIFFRGVSSDGPEIEKALDHWIRAADIGSAEAYYNIASLIETKSQLENKKNNPSPVSTLLKQYSKLEIPSRFSDPIKLYNQSSRLNYPHADLRLGILYSKSNQLVLAEHHFQRAAEANLPDGLLNYAMFLMSGIIREPDYVFARQLLFKGAKLKNIQCMVQYGLFCKEGKGGKQDFKKAFALFEYAAQSNDPMAQYLLGLAYSFGQGTKQDIETGLEWLHKSANQKFQPAIDSLKEFENNAIQDSSTEKVEPES